MDFTVSCSVLRQRLESFIGAVGGKASRPELTGFLFMIHPGSTILHIHASDTELFLTGEVEVSNVDDFGLICVPAHLLLKQLRLLPEQPLTFHVDLDTLEVTVDYDNGHFSFIGYDAQHYPDMPSLVKEEGAFSVSATELTNALSKVLSSTICDMLRPFLSGVDFDLTPSGLNLVGTDGFRLALAGIPATMENSGGSFILVARAVSLLQKQLGQETDEVKITFDSEKVFIEGSQFRMVSLRVLSRYPNYQRVLPDGDANILGVDRSWLISAVRRTASFSLQSQVVKLSFDRGILTVSAEDENYKTYSTERLDIDYFGDFLEVLIRSDFLVDYLNKIDGEKVDLLVSRNKGIPLRIEPSLVSERISMRFIILQSAN